jgi:hypothetical protein
LVKAVVRPPPAACPAAASIAKSKYAKITGDSAGPAYG